MAQVTGFKMNKYAICFTIVFILIITACVSVDDSTISRPLPPTSEDTNIAVIKSKKPVPENLPDTLSVSNTDIQLFEAISLVDSYNIVELDSETSSNTFYEDIRANGNTRKTINQNQNIRYIASIRLLSYEKPNVKLFLGAASSSTQTYQLKMELVVLDLVTGEEYIGTITAQSEQRSKSMVLSQNRSRTIGEESAMGVALEKGIYKLVDLLFK